MAKVQGVFTGVRGQIGNVVYLQNHGRQIMRSKQLGSDRRSAAQIAHRAKVKALSEFANPLKRDFIPQYWKAGCRDGQTPWGRFFAANLSRIDGGFDISALLMTSGLLAPCLPLYNHMQFSSTYNLLYVVQRSSLHSLNAHSTDIPYCLLIDPSFILPTLVLSAAPLRYHSSLNFYVPAGFNFSTYHYFVWFATADFSPYRSIDISNSVYLGPVLP